MARRAISHLEKTLNIWAIILIIWSLYRAKFGTSLPLWFDELLAKPIIFLLPVFYFIKKVEKKDFFKSTGFVRQDLLKETLLGLLIGFVFICILFLGFISRGFFQNLNVIKSLSLIPFLYFLIVSFATSFSEEILSRGFILTRICERFNNIYLSSFFAAILYFFIHIPILFTDKLLTGDLLLRVSTIDFVLGFILSLIFLVRKNIIIPIFIHAFYNLLLSLLV
jgi:membrane protease YdiL (CAAX protease family)